MTKPVLILVLCLALSPLAAGKEPETQVPFPDAMAQEPDPEVARLVSVWAQNWTSPSAWDAQKTIISMGSEAVPSLIIIFKRAANKEPFIIEKPQKETDIGRNELRVTLVALERIADRRALPVISPLVKYDSKARRFRGALEQILIKGSDAQLQQDAKSDDPTIARMAQFILDRPEYYDYHRKGILPTTRPRVFKWPKDWIIQESGWWPEDWPKELEPFRPQARTFDFAGHLRVYEIPFSDRETFERLWPVILGLKDEGGPLVLYTAGKELPENWALTKLSNARPSIRIFAPSGAYARTGAPLEQDLNTPQDAAKLVKQGKALRAAPPWSKDILSPSGELPEYVVPKEVDGKLKWVPFNWVNRAGFHYRSRVDIELIVDGNVIDLKRIPLPPDANVIWRPIGPELKAERDRLLAEAKAKINKGLMELETRYPALHNSNEWRMVLRPLGEAPDNLSIALYNNADQFGSDKTPQENRFRVTVRIQPSGPGVGTPFQPLYPNLTLSGQIDISAGDPQLNAALVDLVDSSLLPLKQLDEHSALTLEQVRNSRSE